MNILVLAPHPFFQHRGTPIAVKLLLEALTDQGHTVDVLAYHEGEEVDSNGWTLHRIPAPPGVRNIRPGFSGKKLICDAALFFKCLGLLRERQYDLVHAVEESAFIALLVKKVYGIPYVYDMDSSLAQQMMEKYSWLNNLRSFLEWWEGLAVRGSSAVVAVCRSLEETARSHDPDKSILRLEDITLLDMADDADGLPPDASVSAPRPIAMYVGNLEPYQGIDLLLEGFAITKNLGHDGSLVVVGGNETDIARYKQKTVDLGIDESVLFLGPRPNEDLGHYLRQADVLVSPRTQGYNTPMKIYSYLDSGTPLLATRLPTHTQVLDDSIALLVDPDPRAMGEGLAQMFGDQGLAARLAANAKRLAQQEFTLEAYQRKLGSFYSDVQRVVQATPRG